MACWCQAFLVLLQLNDPDRSTFLGTDKSTLKRCFLPCWFVVVVVVKVFFNDSMKERSCFKRALIDFLPTARKGSKKGCKHNLSVTNENKERILSAKWTQSKSEISVKLFFGGLRVLTSY